MAVQYDAFPMKFESTSSAPAISAYSAQPETLKRPRSEDIYHSIEKRQRVDPYSRPLLIDDDEIGIIRANASAALIQQFGRTAPGRIDNDQGSFMADPHLYMRVLSLPILESLSTQILSTLGQGPYSETIKIITEPNSELGQAYSTLKSLFDQTKRIYSQQAPFLSAKELNIKEPNHKATIRTTNLATFVSSVFGGQDVGFYELNDHFIEAFTSDDQPLEREPGQLYINLKTQMYLSAVQQEEQERTREDILEDLFPLKLKTILLDRHPGMPLSNSEVEFIAEADARREFLQEFPTDLYSLQGLSEKYTWENFLQNLSVHLRTAYEPLIGPFMKRHALNSSSYAGQNGQIYQSGFNPNALHNSIERDDPFIAAAVEKATQDALRSLGYGPTQFPNQRQHREPSLPYQQTVDSIQHEINEDRPVSGPGTQTASTQILYEKARQAAVSKSQPANPKRPGVPSQRRPWSMEEENALMAGLDAVKGPHWSRILELYGPGGSISEILKDRNQVQLKDKARNLKLFFLKSETEVPYYLQSVTGELKTRAPTQAARKEAEQRAREHGSEEQARFNGIMTLAGGFQDNHS